MTTDLKKYFEKNLKQYLTYSEFLTLYEKEVYLDSAEQENEEEN